MDYLSKYKKEQKLINEFLSIIDNSGNKNKIEEKEEENSEEESEEDYDNKPKSKEFERENELEEKIYLNKKILKEMEKFFMFFATLSAYQIKVLNDTQPKNDLRVHLPILFQNQFKDCLTVKQIIALNNIHEMSLNRYMILKDPDKLILPSNLNIFPAYFDKSELLSPRYFRYDKKKQIFFEKKKRRRNNTEKSI